MKVFASECLRKRSLYLKFGLSLDNSSINKSDPLPNSACTLGVDATQSQGYAFLYSKQQFI